MYSGTNPDTGKRRYRMATVVGNRSDAERGLAELLASVSVGTVDRVRFDGVGIVGGVVCCGERVVQPG